MIANSEVVVVDSITRLPASIATSPVVVAASHGGRYAAAVALRLGVRAVIFNDASIGRDGAGVAGLELLDRHGVPGAAVGADTARIGSGLDQFENGVLSTVNRRAERLGLRAGMSARSAVDLLLGAPPVTHPIDETAVEGRYLLRSGAPRVWALDSVSLTTSDDDGDILVTGSHGALLGEDPKSAVKSHPLAALYNDAGGGRDRRGTSRLPVLDQRLIAGGTVSAQSARIGDGRSTYETGEISTVNDVAAARGAVTGMSAREFVELFARAGVGDRR